MKLEFDKPYFIVKVVINCRFFTDWYHPGDYCVGSEATFRSCVDNANNVDVSVYQGEVKQKSCGTLQRTHGLKQSDQTYSLLCNTRGDTIKLSKIATHHNEVIVVSEIAVISTGSYVINFRIRFIPTP